MMRQHDVWQGIRRGIALVVALCMTLSATPAGAIAEGVGAAGEVPAASGQETGNRLTALRDAYHNALDRKADAEAAVTAAQEAYEQAQEAGAEAAASISAAQKAASDASAALATANQELAAAQQAYEQAQAAVAQNAADIAAAQSAVQAASAAKGDKDDAVSTASQRVQAAEEAVYAAQERLDAANAAIAAQAADPGTNEGHEEWTALGLYRHILENTQESDPAHWDAQAAIDVLTGGTNSTGHAYKQYEGPVPDGNNASTWANISENVNLASRADAVSLDNFKAALDLIDEYNECRAQENSEEGCNLTTGVGMNCRLMAVAAVQLDVSYDVAASGGHTQAYHVGENLSWGYSDPFTGWYDEEKSDWKNGETNRGAIGHYMNIVDWIPLNEYNPTMGTGFAIHTEAPKYRVAHGQVFHTTSGFNQYNPSITYTTDQFRQQWFDPYYAAQLEAGMKGTSAEVSEQNQRELQAAQAQYDAAYAEQQSANTGLRQAQQAQREAAATLSAAEQELSELQAATSGLEEALSSADATRSTKQTAQVAASDAYDEAVDALDELKSDERTQAALAAIGSAEESLAQAQDDATAAAAALTTALAELNGFTNLATSPAITVAPVASATYTGSAIAPKPVVSASLSDEETTPLHEGTDYTLSYAKNMVAGTATIQIKGTGSRDSGTWWGTRQVTFAIAKAPSKVSAPAQTKTYTGKALTYTGKPTTSGSAGAVSYRYFSDAACTKAVAAANVKAAGTYHVRATLAADANHASASCVTTLTIAKAASSVKLANQTRTYTGKALAYTAKPTRSGSAGKVTYKYFSDAKCTKAVAAANVKAAKTYYVRATLAADANHKAATSNVAKLVIAKAANPLTAKAAAKTASLKALKTRAVAVAPITASKAQGKLTYAKASGSAALTVNKASGKVSVKKGTKKGTYAAKVKVTAAGNANYKAKSVTVTVKVTVK